MNNDNILLDSSLVALCGLYCGSCKSFINGKCKGCKENNNAKWCKVRACCLENNYSSCTDCNEYPNTKDCSKFNNIFSRIIGFIANSDRNQCIIRIRQIGYENYAKEMSETNKHTISK